MTTRITNAIVLRQSLGDVSRVRRDLARVQEQATSGLRINRPSDDPTGYRLASGLRELGAEIDQLLRNQDRAEVRLREADESLANVQEILQRAREGAMRGASDTSTAETRGILANEIETLHEQLLGEANAKRLGISPFSGFDAAGPAFTATGDFDNPPAPSVAFTGDPNEIELEIDAGQREATTLDGRRVFLGDGDGNGAPDVGREDLFVLLGDLWVGLQNDDRSAIAATLTRFDTAREQIDTERANAGNRGRRVEDARQSVLDRQVQVREQRSRIEDADSVAVLSELVQRESALETSLAATARAIQPSLLQFLN